MGKENKNQVKSSTKKAAKVKEVKGPSPQVLALCDLIEQGGESPMGCEIYGSQSPFIGDHEIR